MIFLHRANKTKEEDAETGGNWIQNWIIKTWKDREENCHFPVGR